MKQNVFVHMPSFILLVFSYLLIALLFFVVYKKQQNPPKVWKGLLVMFIGIFSFSIHFNLSSEVAKIPILPLGVVFLYWFLRRKGNTERWSRYRRYAWLGFWVNFIFLASSFLNSPLEHLMFPKDQPSTYMQDVEKASLIITHPASKDVTLNNEVLQVQVDKMKQNQIKSESWYYKINEKNGYKEQFPYLLIGTVPEKGSGLKTVIYVEDDGKGFLITPNNGGQVYFRSEESVLIGGAERNE
ncbi:hypothetical protein ACIQZM_00675 [Peribacillus sp. NPDC097206]|uniref:hypothetical protein n=1 Tax=unclassified Peribacillus TaxID=2675266 RepID=UPI003827160C